LESEIEDWRYDSEVSKKKEIQSLEVELNQLKERLETSEDLYEIRSGRTRSSHYNDGSSEQTSDGEELDRTAKRGEKSKALVSVLEARIRNLVERLQSAENDKLNMENELQEMKFERDKATVAAKRLARRANELEDVGFISFFSLNCN
jgi:hypothetical protein